MKSLFKIMFCLFGCLFIGNTFAVNNRAAPSPKTAMAIHSNDKLKTQSKNFNEEKEKKLEDKIYKMMTKLTSDKRSALEKRLKDEDLITSNPFGISFHKPTYVLPYYFTKSPYHEIYRGETPDDQPLRRSEFKAQISFKIPIWHHLFSESNILYFGYTQLSYWQFYARSQYFRETNYEPELFLQHRLLYNWLFDVGVVHESNGRGGDIERSWNRIYANLKFSGEQWMISLKPWLLIFKGQSSNLHNPNIRDYLGHGELVLAYKWRGQVFSFMTRNNLESGFKRGAVEFTYSFPFHKYLSAYVQFFSGYGQSLIEYDHYTSAAGIGIALSDWI